MLTMAGIGAGIPLARILSHDAPLLLQAPNAIAGTMTLYLVITSQAAVRRKTIGVGALEFCGLAVALAVTAAGATFIAMIMNSPPERSAVRRHKRSMFFYSSARSRRRRISR